MNGTVGEIVTNTIRSMPVEITDGEEALFNSFPSAKVVPALRELMREDVDPVIVSRALDALLKLEQFDKVQYLIGLLGEPSVQWRLIACRHLSRFQDKRAVKKLTAVVLDDDDADVRCCAAEALAAVGDETAIDALEYVRAHDDGLDYEGRSVSKMARYAIEGIQS